MTSFYLASVTMQMTLLISLFLSIVLALFILIGDYGIQHDKHKRYLHIFLFVFLFILLSLLADAFSKISEGLDYRAILSLPVWSLFLITCVIDILLIWEIRELYILKKNSLSRDSIKEALDMLPSGICYFMPSGSVKLCNKQMNSLFHALSQSDLQNYKELQDALSECDDCSGVIRFSKDGHFYLFPDGKVWRYQESDIQAQDGAIYKEAIFSDVTELYNKNLELKAQIKHLDAISRELKWLSDNALILAREKEILSAKTKLHDDMGAGLIAIRHILNNNQTKETVNSLDLFRQAVSAIKYDNSYSLEHSELDRFMHDAKAIGIKVNMTGDLPKKEDYRNVMILAMRECLTNSVIHADATTINIKVNTNNDCITMKITNDGRLPESEVVPKGGLHNLYRHIMDCGGTMEIQPKPEFGLTISFPYDKEDAK